MAGIQICLGQAQIGLDHIHGGMAQHLLESVAVAAIAEIVDRKGVAEAVDVGSLDAGLFRQGADQVQQLVAVQGIAGGIGEQRGA